MSARPFARRALAALPLRAGDPYTASHPASASPDHQFNKPTGAAGVLFV